MKRDYTLPTRAEEMGNRLFDYFAMPTQSFYQRLLKGKAAVLVGGRGTGKTMLFKSMAFEYKVNSLPIEEIWNQENYLGCYIRIDTNVVSSFRGRGIEQEMWGGLFAHYFNLRVAQQITKTLTLINKFNLLNDTSLDVLIARYFEILGEACPNTTLDCVESSIRNKLYELARYINNPSKFDCPALINNGDLIFGLCDVLKDKERFESKTWFILLDEYENLDENQQRIVNTLIKANQPPVIFKIAMKPGGWWTKQTLALTESLESIADFDLIDYQTDFSDEDYIQLVIEAFQKSLALNQISHKELLDVRNLLPELSPEDEAKRIENKSKRSPGYKDKIRKYIEMHYSDEDIRKNLESQLIIDEEPLRTRLHLVLLDRGLLPEEIAVEREKNSAKYQELYRHNRIGTLFLFCSDYQVKKKYTGFETFILLSSKIMRNFVNLFSRTWELSIEQGFSVEKPQPFNFDIQSKAAYDVSQGRVFEISSYASIGPILSSFANQLGRIFEQLNKDEKQSQPERNHFSISGEISEDAQKLLRGALRFSVLQEAPATKVKADVEVRGKDYLLNRIYCPYYNMSYRKMHKLELKGPEFEALIKGRREEKQEVASKILKVNLKKQAPEHPQPSQLNLIDSLFRGDQS